MWLDDKKGGFMRRHKLLYKLTLMLLAAALITAFPEIALWLPETMR
jgi:TRAP-type C4-dicarboxylate transport system permease large subunit